MPESLDEQMYRELEMLISQLKNGVHALHAPVNTMNTNGAYMLMASLAWTLKAWFALSLPISHERSRMSCLSALSPGLGCGWA